MPDWNALLTDIHLTQTIATADATYAIPLEQGLIEIKGPDAAKFLQGQVTCDVNGLANHKSLLGAQCNIKGRMLLCFLAVQTDSERIILRVHSGLVANGLSSLGKYIVFSKAKLADVTSNYLGLGIAGPNATQVISDVFAVNIAENGEWQPADNHIITRIDEHRYECWLAADNAESIWQQVTPNTIIASQNLWNLFNIQAGIGDISPETYETFTPQAINFQLVNGINFRKGCYTGQEIVARLHYRGTLKRHMYRFEFSLTDNLLPASGTELKNAAGKTVGEVIVAAYKNPDSGELLASVVDDERVAIYLENNPQKLSLLALPYAIPTPNEAD
ncbi:MAG: folate-binding protein [Gammaproteobacteria bacterium]|nr:MAG: folate-binding protein [Gammaproteobacteria bacterium]